MVIDTNSFIHEIFKGLDLKNSYTGTQIYRYIHSINDILKAETSSSDLENIFQQMIDLNKNRKGEYLEPIYQLNRSICEKLN